MKKTNTLLFAIAIIIYSLAACTTKEKDHQEQTNIDSIDLEANFKQAKKIFYNLPSPPEVSELLLTNSTVDFNETTLNPLENIDHYESSVKQALNMGIYSTDFSFASMSGQDQIAISYLANSKMLARKLGIAGILGQDTIKLLTKNFSNKDSLMDIITLVYRRSEAYFNENDKSDLALLMAIGGWTEGLYIATELAKKMDFSPVIMDKISEQRLSMEIIVQIIESNSNEPNIYKYHDSFTALNKTYINYSKMLADDLKSGDKVSNSTKTEFITLSDLVVKLRTEFIN
jgi:hypothetical protein